MRSDEVKRDRKSWVVGGGLLLGLGVGSMFLSTSALIFIGCTLGGLGLGLVVAGTLPKR